MDKLLVEGGFELNGSIKSSGAKNSALPILASSILLDDPIIIKNIPHLNDVTTMLELLGSMGVDMTLSEDMEVELNPSGWELGAYPIDLTADGKKSPLFF